MSKKQLSSYLFLVLYSPWLMTSCATITTGSVGMNRDITILSDPSGADIYIDGVPKGVTPTKLQMSSRDLTRRDILVSKKGYKTATFKATDGLNGMMFGNVVFGGLGGAVVDGISGNATNTKKAIRIKLEPKK